MAPAVRVPTDWRTAMLSYAVIFLVIAVIAAVLGFSGIAGAAGTIAWILSAASLSLPATSFFGARRVGPPRRRAGRPAGATAAGPWPLQCRHGPNPLLAVRLEAPGRARAGDRAQPR